MNMNPQQFLYLQKRAASHDAMLCPDDSSVALSMGLADLDDNKLPSQSFQKLVQHNKNAQNLEVMCDGT